MRLLLDEMYPRTLDEALLGLGIDSTTVAGLRMSGAPDAEVFAVAQADERAVLTENVADFARLAADYLSAGRHHCGLLIALSSRFTRRPDGIAALVAAIAAVAGDDLPDRVVYLRTADSS